MSNGQTNIPKATAPLFDQYAVEQYFLSLMFGRPDTDERLKEIGITRVDLRKLEGDDEISAACETRREAVISTPWHLEPGTSRNANFIWNELDDHLDSIVRASWNAVKYGYSVAERVYRRYPDGKIGLAQVDEKPFEWFIPEIDGTLKYNSPNGGIFLVDTQFKFLLTVRDQSYRQPYGEALFSRLYSAWYYRVHGWRFWMKFLERTGAPMLLGKTQGETESLATALNLAVQSGSIAVSAQDDVAILSSAATGESFDRFEAQVAKRIQKLILGQTLTSDIGSSGSYAAAKVHDDVRKDRRNADIRLVSRTVQNVIDALWALNRFPGTPPVFKMEDDLGLQPERADRDSKLVNAGICKLTEDYLLRVYDFEQGDFKIVEQPDQLQQSADETKQPTSTNDTGVQDNAPSFVGKQIGFAAGDKPRFTPEQQVIEDTVDAALLKGSQPVSDESIRNAIIGARSPEDLDARLAVLLGEVQGSALTKELMNTLFSVDVDGYAHAGG